MHDVSRSCDHTLMFLLHVCLFQVAPVRSTAGRCVCPSVAPVCVSVKCALTRVCVSDVDGAGVRVAEGGSAALRRGTLGEDPLFLPLHRPHCGQPEGPLEDHAQAQAGVTHTCFIMFYTHVPVLKPCVQLVPY